MTMLPVTVVMPAFNSSSTIAMSLESVAKQSCAAAAVIVVDDGSTDETSKVAAAFQNVLPLEILTNPVNLGIASSLQRALRTCSTPLVARLDSDDTWEQAHLTTLFDLLNPNDAVGLVCARSRYVDETGEEMRQTPMLSDREVRRRLMWDNPLVHSATMFRLDCYRAAGGYDPTSKWEDYSLWIRMLQHCRFRYSPYCTVNYRYSTTSLSRVGYAAAITARSNCQLSAVRAFWHVAPASAFAFGTVALFRRVLSELTSRRVRGGGA